MDKELSVIDGILFNLAGVLRFYEFEKSQHQNILRLLKQFQAETCKEEELALSNDIFSKESDKEIKTIEEKIEVLRKKAEQVRAEISKRNDSREKLVSLFNALTSVDSLDDLTIPKIVQEQKQSYSESGLSGLDLPIMEIREELNEDDEIISSEIKPYHSSEAQLKSLLNGKTRLLSEEKKAVKKPDGLPDQVSEKVSLHAGTNRPVIGIEEQHLDEKDDPKSDKFRPFVIREEIDEDGNIIKSSMSRIPQVNPSEGEKADNADTTSDSFAPVESKELEDDQLAELFEDMGFDIPKISEVIQVEDSVCSTPKEGSSGDDDMKKDKERIIKVALKEEPSSHAGSRHSSSFSVSEEDLYTLELISDELNKKESEEECEEELSASEEEDGEEEDGESEELDDCDIQTHAFSSMFGSKGQSMFAQQIMKLRGQNTSKELDTIVVEEAKDLVEGPKISEIIQETSQVKSPVTKLQKPSKSVSFNHVVDVKQVDDIWDDIRRSNAELEVSERKNIVQSSLFKRSRDTAKVCEEDPSTSGEQQSEFIVSDIVERQVVECAPNPDHVQRVNLFKAFDTVPAEKTTMQSKEKEDLLKISGKRGPSKFRLARVAEIGKKFQETHIPAETREQLLQAADSFIERTRNSKPTVNKKVLKTNLKSLKHNGLENSSKHSKIETPKDVNPLPVDPQSLADEDYEIVRHEVNDSIFDDDEDMPEEEFVLPERYDLEPQNLADSAYNSKPSSQSDSQKKEYFPNYKKPSSSQNTEIVDTTLDYKSLSGDMDTMAKAYVLGLYDDDIHTTGAVIEKLDDFKKHNQIIEDEKGSQLHERVNEINNDEIITEVVEENKPLLVSDIVENDLDEIMEANSVPDEQLDIELSDETLATQVALDYAKIRSNMIHKYNGGFKETDKEKEFVKPDGSEKVSRFKMARLGI